MRFIIPLLIFLSLDTFGQVHKGFRWIGQSNELYSIDSRTGKAYKENLNSGLIDLGKIKNWETIIKELPGDFDINTFYRSDSLLITIPGTGHIYNLNLSTLEIIRIDQTYFRGYNFNASQFFRNDTLFSIGGEGFWLRHSIITYYNRRTLEWDFYKSINKNHYPVNNKFSGYSKEHDAFFSAYLDTDSVLNGHNIYFSIFDFRKHIWNVKGKLSKELTDFAKKKYKTTWTGKYLIVFNDSNLGQVLIADPFKNVLYEYENPNDRLLVSNADTYYRNGYLYSLNLISTGKSGKATLDSLSIDTLVENSTKIAQVYETGLDLRYYFILLLCFIVFVGVFYKFYKTRTKQVSIDLSDTEIKVITLLTNMMPVDKMSSSELNNLLQISHKSYDNQRQIRNRFISTINQKLYSHFESKEFILRSSNVEDKRMMDYYINPDIKQKELEKFLGIT